MSDSTKSVLILIFDELKYEKSIDGHIFISNVEMFENVEIRKNDIQRMTIKRSEQTGRFIQSEFH